MSLIFTQTPAFIASGDTTSAEIQCLGKPALLLLPATFTTSDLTFLISNVSGGTYSNALKDTTGNPVNIASVAENDCISLDASIFEGIQFFKIVTSNAQAANRIITVVFTPIYGNYLN